MPKGMQKPAGYFMALPLFLLAYLVTFTIPMKPLAMK